MFIDENLYKQAKDFQLPAIRRHKLSPLCKDHSEEQKLQIKLDNIARERAEKIKHSPFRLLYNPSKDFKLIESEKSLKLLKERGLSKLSLNDAYRHV
jgi:hypothetical protein